MLRRSCKAQVISEWVVLASIVLAVALGMLVYVKRGLAARYKAVVDMGKPVFGLTQYEPYYNISGFGVMQYTQTTETKDATAISYGFNDVSASAGTSIQGTDVTYEDTWK